MPLDLTDWVGEDDLVHCFVEAVERVDIRAFRVNWRGHGKAQGIVTLTRRSAWRPIFVIE